MLLGGLNVSASEYSGTLSVVTALVVFVGLPIGHGETKQSEDHKNCALDFRGIRDSVSDEFLNWTLKKAAQVTQLFEAEMKRAILCESEAKRFCWRTAQHGSVLA